MLPPFRLYSGRELLEVLLWQGMGLVGWPVGLVGGLANLLLHRAGTDLVSLLLAMYPLGPRKRRNKLERENNGA